MILDYLDKKILRYLSSGTNSYEDLAHICNVTRNTVYRRIASLENRGIIKNTLSCIVNLDQLDLTTITIGVNVSLTEQKKALYLLAAHRDVRLLFRSYGNHNVTLVAFCSKGKEGELIQSITAILEEVNATNIDVSVGFSWEKMDLTTFYDPLETEQQVEHVIKSRH